ncbi:MAG: hemolysin family protein [Thermomicrobiales bacterium]
MDGDGWRSLIFGILALLVMTSAAVTQALVGMASLQRLRSQPRDSNSRERSVARLIDPRRAIAASMTFVQVVAAIIATGQFNRFFDSVGNGDSPGWLSVVTVTLWFVVFAQALPRALIERNIEPVLDRFARFGHLATVGLRPVNWIADRIGHLWSRILPGTPIEPLNDGLEEELHPSRYGLDDGTINADEREMIDGILSLEEVTARDIMVPRLDIIAVDRAIASADLIDIITKAGHSRIPVFQQSIDRVLGVLYVKDLLPFVIGNTIRIPILDLIRPAFVVPESKKVSDLFRELKRSKIHIAIVADEYGGTAGLVTIEDILEEIVGEIQDEYDTESPLFEQVSPDVLVADGRLPIEDVEDALRIRFEDDDFGTLGGFVHKHLGRLPVQGDVFEAEGVKLEILSVERHRVRALRITKLEIPEELSPRERRHSAAAEEADSDLSDDLAS